MRHRQGSLFELLPAENPDEAIGVVGMVPAIRAEMHRAAAAYEPGRKQLVEAVSKVAQRKAVALNTGGAKAIEVATLDKWLQPAEKGHAPSLEAIVCFCLAVGSASPVKPLLKALGLVAIPAADVESLEYGKLCMKEKRIRDRKKALEAKLK